jgi:hypothetical protein
MLHKKPLALITPVGNQLTYGVAFIPHENMGLTILHPKLQGQISTSVVKELREFRNDKARVVPMRTNDLES